MAGAGTGEPISFLCPQERREKRYRDLYHKKHHVIPTGRTKPRRTHSLGQRHGRISYEYRCETCGHVGWSSHYELERLTRR